MFFFLNLFQQIIIIFFLKKKKYFNKKKDRHGEGVKHKKKTKRMDNQKHIKGEAGLKFCMVPLTQPEKSRTK